MNGRIKLTVSFLFISVLMLKTVQGEIQGDILNVQIELGKPCGLQCRVVNGTKADMYMRWKENERFVKADPSNITTSVYLIENFTEDYLLSKNVSCIYGFEKYDFDSKRLKERFIYFPDNREISYRYIDAKTTMRLEVRFPEVYPQPSCSFFGKIAHPDKERYIANLNHPYFTLDVAINSNNMVPDFSKNGSLYSGRCYQEWSLKDFRCTSQQPDCLLKGERFPNEPMKTNCYEVMEQSKIAGVITGISFGLVAIGLFLYNLYVGVYFKKSTTKTKRSIHSWRTFNQYLSTFATLIGNPFLYGYNMAVLNNPAMIIALSVLSEDGTSVLEMVKQFGESKSLNMKWSFGVAVYVFSGFFGVLLANNIANYYGRKKPLILNSLFVILASCLSLGINGAPTYLQQYLLFGYRAVLGFLCGIGLVISGMYLMEVSRLTVNSVNGSYGTYNRWFQFYITFGIAVASVLGHDEILGNKDRWMYLLAFNAIPAACNLLLFIGPESPIFVYLNSENEEKLKNMKPELIKLCKPEELSEKIEIVKKAAAAFEGIRPTQFSSVIDLLLDTKKRREVIPVCILQAAQQLSGINVIIAYSNFIYQRSGVLFEIAEWNVFLTALINCFSTFITLAIKQDRKKFIVGPTICMGVAMFCLFVTNLWCHDYQVMCPFLAITIVSFYVVAFSVGLGPIPYLVIQEKFEDQKTQGAVFTLSLAINWGCNCLMLISFRMLHLWMESYVYLMLAVMIFSISVYFCKLEPDHSGSRESQ